jgi:dienelactone hydrolase
MFPSLRPPSRREFLGSAAAAAAHPHSAIPNPQSQRSDLPRDPPRDLKPSGAELGSLFPDVAALAGPAKYPESFLTDRFRALDEFRTAARARIRELLGYQPEKVPPRPEVVERVDQGDHIREKVLFWTAPHVRVPAYVLVPKGVKGRGPGVVDLHSHGGMYLFGKEKVIDLGRNHPAMVEYQRDNYDGRPTATALVRRGYVVISIDALLFGERRPLLDADLKYGWDRSRYGAAEVRHLNEQCRTRQETLAKAMILAGLTWTGVVVWDDLRTVDYLAARPEVDPQRIGCVGISMGGFRSLFLAALDDRIAAACVVGFMSAVRPMIKAHLDIHSWVHFVPGLHRFLDLPDVAIVAAPRPLLVQQCARDKLFPPEGMKEAVAKISAGYNRAGARERFSGRFHDEPHRFSRKMQDEAFAWLDKHLKG